MPLIAILTIVEPFTPRNAMYAIPKAATIATSAMNTGPGVPALMVPGAKLPTIYPIMIPIVATIAPG